MHSRSLRPLQVREADAQPLVARSIPLRVPPSGHGSASSRGRSSVFLGLGIFFFIALLCIVAFFGARKQRRRYEETGSLDPGE